MLSVFSRRPEVITTDATGCVSNCQACSWTLPSSLGSSLCDAVNENIWTHLLPPNSKLTALKQRDASADRRGASLLWHDAPGATVTFLDVRLSLNWSRRVVLQVPLITFDCLVLHHAVGGGLEAAGCETRTARFHIFKPDKMPFSTWQEATTETPSNRTARISWLNKCRAVFLQLAADVDILERPQVACLI